MTNTTARRPKRPVFNTTLILISTAAILGGALAWIVVVFFGRGPAPVPDVLAPGITLQFNLSPSPDAAHIR